LAFVPAEGHGFGLEYDAIFINGLVAKRCDKTGVFVLTAIDFFHTSCFDVILCACCSDMIVLITKTKPSKYFQ
jgi:hypothetical protein